jgi:hypothetical protein
MGAGGTAVVPFNTANPNPLGVVSTIPVENAAGAALSVAVDPSDRLFYIGETVATSGSNTGGLRAFNFTTLKELSGSPLCERGPRSILDPANLDRRLRLCRQSPGKRQLHRRDCRLLRFVIQQRLLAHGFWAVRFR